MIEPASPSSGRAKRQKIDKKGRISALEKLKQLKGSKNKYEIDAVDNVYEEVDEQEYSKRVLRRQDDDWIVDDDGSGYVEDGRDIFDDDLDSASIQHPPKIKKSGPRKDKSRVKDQGNISSMLMGMSAKKDSEYKLDDDDMLKDLIAELRDAKPEAQTQKIRQSNKFLVAPKANLPYTQTKPETSKTSKFLINDAAGSQQIDNSSDDEELFQQERNIEKKGNIKQSVTEEKLVQATTSATQDIDDTSDTETVTHSEQSKLPVDKPAVHDTIEQTMGGTEKDISHSIKDLSYFDIEDSKETKASEQIVEDFEMLNEVWDDAFGEQIAEVEVSVDKGNLPLHTNEKGEKVFRFYYWDAFEDPYKQPGIVYLFGKVFVDSANAFVSCCVRITNVDRRIYLFPRKYVKPKDGDSESEPKLTSMMDVYKEFNEHANAIGIKSFRSRTVTKSYAFDVKDVPKTSEYMEVRYPAEDRAISANYSGAAIEHVFGTSDNALELLLIEQRIKGPCWLDVRCAIVAKNPVSWCKIEIDCVKCDYISLTLNAHGTPPPPLVVATINVQTTFNTKSHRNEIAMIGVLLNHKYHIDKPTPKLPFNQHFCLVTRPEDAPWVMVSKDLLQKSAQTEIIYCDNERSLLEKLLHRLVTCDPDLLVGYDTKFQFDVMLHRMFNLRVSNWSRVGRLRRSLPPVFKGQVLLGQVMSGRLLCDIQTSAKELNLKVRSYDLPTLCTNVLKKNEGECKEVKPEETIKYYASLEKLVTLVQLIMKGASDIVTIMLELNVMPLALQITCLAGNVLSRTLTAGRAERNEFLLLHAFYEKGYIAPDKRAKTNKSTAKEDGSDGKKKAAYTGGLVLEPKKGFYDTLILLMDFNSLYPSIIQEYNICFTTIAGAAHSDDTDPSVPETSLEPGIIPTEIKKLVESRVQVKNLMKTPNISPELKLQYNTRQLALKLTANSMYGCLGATYSRFYAKRLAALVTAKGREILVNTKNLVESLGYQVIYGDTDSIMINTNTLDYEQAFAIGKKIRQQINKLYQRVELDIDGVFRYLLLQQKKKYAAVVMNKLSNGKFEMTQELKGLDIVRRDWCQLACELGRNVLTQVFCDQPFETRLENIYKLLQTVSKTLKEGNVPLSALVITKQLSKDPEKYSDTMPIHVKVALQLNQRGGRKWKTGDIVPYIICEDGTSKSASDRAYHVDELKNSETLKVDANYYLQSQLFPVIIRLCEPIEGIDNVLIAQHLGLPEKYKSNQYNKSEDDSPAIDARKFKYCTPLKFLCLNQTCRTPITMDGAFTRTPAGIVPMLSRCPNIDCNMAPWQYWQAIQNRLQLAIREAIQTYYEGWMECEDPACSNRIRRVPQQFFGGHPVCSLCQKCIMFRTYTETQLYNQMSYYLYIFDLNQPKYENLVSQLSADVRHAYNTLKEFVEKQLQSSAYANVDLTRVFSYLDSNWTKTKVLQDQRRLAHILFSDEPPSPIRCTTLDFTSEFLDGQEDVDLSD
ncbi:DNA polymerase alpha catalytic subunit isoform X2 [Athalia rosae]|uniref:DNA polymerase alpha catalytic subunit isoform X2 n=1 Tax=Athalia rosae TaxID=37344 RepID=UPI0020335B8E|nr:DNA polymerase alpha catalytic subunit isoform X2 [Athalia rosae]